MTEKEMQAVDKLLAIEGDDGPDEWSQKFLKSIKERNADRELSEKQRKVLKKLWLKHGEIGL